MGVSQLPTLYTEAQTARLLSPAGEPPISTYTVRRLRLAGKLGCVRVGRKVMYREDQIAAYLNSVTDGACQETTKTDSNSGTFGSHNRPAPQIGAGRGSTNPRDKRNAL